MYHDQVVNLYHSPDNINLPQNGFAFLQNPTGLLYLMTIHHVCLSLFRLLTEYNRLGAYKQHKCISHSFRGWEAQDQDTNQFGVW